MVAAILFTDFYSASPTKTFQQFAFISLKCELLRILECLYFTRN